MENRFCFFKKKSRQLFCRLRILNLTHFRARQGVRGEGLLLWGTHISLKSSLVRKRTQNGHGNELWENKESYFMHF